MSHTTRVITFSMTLHLPPNESSVYAHTGYCLVNIMKDIHFWRGGAKSRVDIIGCDRSNAGREKHTMRLYEYSETVTFLFVA